MLFDGHRSGLYKSFGRDNLQLYDLLASPKKLMSFSETDGADLHCEPKGTGLRDLRVFNWLDETLA
jgi:hypothetical protein